MNFASIVIGAGVLSLMPVVVSASVVTVGPGGFNDGWATTITYENDNTVARRGSSNGRDNPLNALGPANSTQLSPNFFEIGLGSQVDFTFGTLFTSPLTVVEVTFGSVSSFPESVNVQFGLNGAFTSVIGSISNNGAQGPGGFSFSFTGGPFDTVRLIDTSPTPANSSTGGFDVDAIRVTAVPLPASALLLLAAVGGLAATRRRKS